MNAAAPATFADLEKQTREYELQCVTIEDLVAALESDLEAIKRKHLPALKRQAGVVANRQAELQASIESAPELFVKPRTLVINGCKIGYNHSVGSITWDDDAHVIALIRELRKKQAAILIDTTEKPSKSALKTLKPAELLELGCRIEGDGDQVVLSRVAGDVERLVNKLVEKIVEAMTTE